MSGEGQRTYWLYTVLQLSSEERKRKMVLDMEEHLSELHKDVEQLKQHTDPAADAKYNNLIYFWQPSSVYSLFILL